MLRDVAVTRIQNGLGWRNDRAATIILRMDEAQRELEKGKTLPRFLLLEGQVITFTINTSSFNIPAGFLRVDEDDPPQYIPVGETTPRYLTKLGFRSSIEEFFNTDETGAPRSYTIRGTTIRFFPVADKTYTGTWSYYKAAVLPSAGNAENAWLANAPEWLIGEAGYRIAFDLRDKDAMALFGEMRKVGRASLLANIIAEEDSDNLVYMGSDS